MVMKESGKEKEKEQTTLCMDRGAVIWDLVTLQPR